MTTIGQVDPASGRPQFDDYQSLYIDGKHATPEGAFLYLLKKRVFRPGLCFRCPNCELDSWVHLDDAQTIHPCEYCGTKFNVAPQLRDRDWAYRRSGLFGRNDNQGGGIPVALTLIQLQTVLHNRILAYTTGTNLRPTTANIQNCETDFVMIAESRRENTLQVAIGECKSDGGVIEIDDAQKMGRVADALAGKDCEVFVVFSKTSTFTPDEVASCQAAQGTQSQRVILLSKRELEPHFLYERTSKEFEILHPHASSFEQMARATHTIYFEPRPKTPMPPS